MLSTAIGFLFILLCYSFLSRPLGSGIGNQGGSPTGTREGVLDADSPSGDNSAKVASQGVPQSVDNLSEEVPTNEPEVRPDSLEPEADVGLEIEETKIVVAGSDTEIEESTPSAALLSRVPNRQASGGLSAGPLGGGTIKSGVIDAELEATGGVNPFFGDGEPANSTVFVIDVSGSMQSADRLPRVIRALSRAIDQLKSKQRLCVLLFDDGYYAFPTDRLVDASARNKEEIQRGLIHPPGGGGTNPLSAMELAIGLNPERIVLLSDGEFDPNAIAQITTQNKSLKKPARIDCVGLMEQVVVLQEIARQNQGVYYQAW
jgi:hypothetical protein